MKFFEKVKNMFTDEVEEEDVKVEQITKDVTHVSIESPNINKIDSDENDDSIKLQVEKKNNRPVFFDDNDFEDLDLQNKREEHNANIEKNDNFHYKNIYDEKENEREKAIKKEEIEKRVFKPTPIISPVYGILDKNYHKEDIVSRNEVKHENTVSEPSVDTIRNKAYGTLEDELENTLFGNNSILFKKDKEEPEPESDMTEVNDDILSCLTDDISKELDDLLVKKEKYSKDDYKKDTKKENNLNEEDLLGFIDSTLYKEGDEEE